MVDIKAAVKNATDFARDLLGPDRTPSIRLEEIESARDESNDIWLITLSSRPVDDPGQYASLAAVLGADSGREYKQLAVAKETGEVLSMKIRLFPKPQ